MTLWLISPAREPVGDSAMMVETARTLAVDGRLDLPYPSKGYSLESPDGHHYMKFQLAWSLVEIPGAALERMISTSELEPAMKEIALRLARGMTPSTVGATGILLLYLALFELGVGRRNAAIVALAFSFAGPAFPYLRSHYSEGWQFTIINGGIWALVKFRRHSTFLNGLLFGLFSGLAIFTKISLAPFVTITAIGALVIADRSVLGARKAALAGFVGALPFLAGWMAWDLVRHHRILPTDYGYFPVPVTVGLPTFEGLFGLLLSPGRGLIWFMPLSILAIAGFMCARRRANTLAMTLGVGMVASILFHAGYSIWHGAEQWGPRFLVPMVGPIAVLSATWLSDPSTRRSRVRFALPVLVAVGLFVNIPGILIHHMDFYAVVPYKPYADTPIGPDGRPSRPVELDNLHRVNFEPTFSPITGHWWLLARAIDHGDLKESCPWKDQVGDAPVLRTDRFRPRINLWFAPDHAKGLALGPSTIALVMVQILMATLAWFEFIRFGTQEASAKKTIPPTQT